MVKVINHDVRVVDGSTIYMPAWFQGESGWGNLKKPNIYTADAVQQYPCGTRFVEGDRWFRYARYLGSPATYTTTAITATDGDDIMGKFLMQGAYQQDYADSLVVRHVAGETSSWIGTTVATDRSDDFYSGGFVNGKDTAPADARHFSRRIVAHNYDAAKTVGGTAYTYVSELQLDQPITNSKTSMAVTVMPNCWKRILWYSDTASAQYYSAMGACMVNDPTATYFVWLQTHGPMACHHVANANVGASNFEMVYYILGDGSVQGIDSSTDTYGIGEGQFQIAGRILSNTIIEGATGADEGLPILWIELE